MTDPLFADSGPEGRNADAREFEGRLVNGFAKTVRWGLITSSADTWLPPTRRSQGLDAICAVPNARAGRGDGWVLEAKRHGDASRYTHALLTEEVQRLRDKVVSLQGQPQRFLRDPQIAPHIQEMAGGILFHHCRDFPRERVRTLLGDLTLHGRAHGPRPVRVLLIGPDDLNSLGEAICRYGSPIEFWWPAGADAVAAWAPACPPEQLAAGVVFFRTAQHGTVLLIREELERRDLEAVSDLVWRFGHDVDVVACASLQPEKLKILAGAWREVRNAASRRDSGRLPERIDALEISMDTMASFDRAWTPEGPAHAGAATRRSRRQPTLTAADVALAARSGRRRRRRALSAYPSAVSVHRTFDGKASLVGARSFLASERVIVFADEKRGAAVAGGEVWFLPQAYRRMGDQLETGRQPAVTGMRIRRSSGQAPSLPDLGRGTLFEEFTAAAQRLRGVEVGDKDVRLVGHESRDGPWDLAFELVYEDVYDLLGGDQIARDAHVSLFVREVETDELDVCIVTDEPSDRMAARVWLNTAFQAASRGWHLLEVALPITESARIKVLTDVIRATAGAGLMGVASPDQHRERSASVVVAAASDEDDPFEAEFVSGIRGARYDTELLSIEAVLARSRRNQAQVDELTAYRQLPAGSPTEIVALRARQAPGDAFLSLTWKGGRRHTEQTAEHGFSIDLWAEMRALAWTGAQKRDYLIDRWAEATDAVRTAERETVAQLRRAG